MRFLLPPVLLLVTACGSLQREGGQAGSAASGPASAAKTDEKPGVLERLLAAIADTPSWAAPSDTDALRTPALLADDPEVELPESAGSFVVAPIPFVSPTIGPGLALGGAYLIPLDPGSPPSTFGGGVMYSENESFAVAVGFKGYFDEDRYRVSAGVVGSRLNFDLRVHGVDVPLRENIVGFGAEALVRVSEELPLYVGPQLVATAIDTDLRFSQMAGIVPDDELDAVDLGLGFRAQWDTRDSSYYPRTGVFVDGTLRVYAEALGSAYDYQVLPIAYNQFASLGEKDVLAFRASGRFAFGDVPFYAESYLGAKSDLRGYSVGTYHDDTMLATQLEYRRELFWRLGAVAFAGVGAVMPELDDLNDTKGLRSLGLGLRINLEPKNHVNFRIDYAWGEDEHMLYISVGEAF